MCDVWEKEEILMKQFNLYLKDAKDDRVDGST